MRFLGVALLTLSSLGIIQVCAQSKSSAERIQEIADASGCTKLGESSKEYIRGMALMFAKAVCHPELPEAQVASAPPTAPISNKNPSDAISVFDGRFRQLKLPNNANADTMLRHTYTLLTGLGFRESSGQYCKGRYTNQGFSASTSAEAGLFQTSWGAHIYGPSLEKLFRAYQADRSRCRLDVFKDHARCNDTDAVNWNSEHSKDLSGVEWQELTKHCPAFAVEYAAVVIREHGGARGEFGPIKCYAGTQPYPNCRKAEVYPVCDAMFSQIQKYLAEKPTACRNF